MIIALPHAGLFPVGLKTDIKSSALLVCSMTTLVDASNPPQYPLKALILYRVVKVQIVMHVKKIMK